MTERMLFHLFQLKWIDEEAKSEEGLISEMGFPENGVFRSKLLVKVTEDTETPVAMPLKLRALTSENSLKLREK